MKKPLHILALFLIYPGIASAGDESNTVSKLNVLCAKQAEFPESLVRPASLLVQERYLNKPWDNVRAELVKQGLRVPEGRDTQYMMLYDVPVAADVFHVGDISFDLVLEFEVDKGTKEDAPTARHSQILTATASLRAAVGMPTAEVIASSAFSSNSVLGRALSAPVRQERDGGYTVLKRIEMSYDLIRNHHESAWPYGYHLSLFFGRPSEEQWRKRIYLTVMSSEDPPRDRNHNVVRNWRRSKMTGLNSIQFWGSEEMR